ncbi:MAG: hypothetical protein MUP63_00705 [Candidatus Nanohaloarchaeota archaeon QJJ-7]|nr:hypothetical protein [Candidatus Nanohaloarchaeota archaeon QJJ-7]
MKTDKTYIMVFFLALTVFLAGCTVLQERETEDKPDIVQIEGPGCQLADQTCSSGPFTKYDSPARVRLNVENNGDSGMKVSLGRLGREVMVSKCNEKIANITGYTVRNGSSGNLDTREAWDGDKPWEKVHLEGEEELMLEWELAVVPGNEDVPSLGWKCPMEFEIGFNQTIESRNQIQLKDSEGVSEVRQLSTSTTSKKPVRLVVESPESFVASGDRTLVTKAYIENVGRGEIMDIFSINPDSELLSSESCEPSNDNLRMYGGGEREGQSYRRVCRNETLSLKESSVVNWVGYTSKLRYEVDLGTRTIAVNPVEG